MEENVIKIPKKNAGEDGYKIFSIRVKEKIAVDLDELAAKSNRSRNELINILLEYGIKHTKIDD